MISAIIGGIKAAASAFGASKLGGAALKAAPAILGNVASTAFNKSQVDTSYQRTMRDMRKAGINPLLAGKVGPIGSSLAADFGGTLSTARQIGNQETQTLANIDQIAQQIENMSDQEKAQEIDNKLKEILLKKFEEQPDLYIWKTLGGNLTNPTSMIAGMTYVTAEKVVNALQNSTGQKAKTRGQHKHGK